ncbi:MAG: serine protease, partial [Nevskia sp.]|nr:serine protease [Nevskia sp.]
VEAIADVAVLRLEAPPPMKMITALPLRLSDWRPDRGETVLAVGFPELDCQTIDGDAMRGLLSEGMYGAYGRVIDLHPHGRSQMDANPVIEIEADWPSGMSGGPVFNKSGEVVGVVSRSIPSDDTTPGRCVATCLQFMPWLSSILPAVDPINPGWRLGWGVQNLTSKRIESIFEHQAHALKHVERLGPGHAVIRGVNRIGTDEFLTDFAANTGTDVTPSNIISPKFG